MADSVAKVPRRCVTNFCPKRRTKPQLPIDLFRATEHLAELWHRQSRRDVRLELRALSFQRSRKNPHNSPSRFAAHREGGGGAARVGAIVNELLTIWVRD
jgi:hypothetical protein